MTFAILLPILAMYSTRGGIRISLVADLLEMDITYGEGFRRQETAPGFNVGIAFTPDTLW